MSLEILRSFTQGSEEWFNCRLGSVGGSTIGKITAKGGVQRKKLLYELAGEIITGQPAESFKFQHADRGTETEPIAKALYSFRYGVTIEDVALIRDTERPNCHYSPDGLISDDGMIEVKTRIPSIFIEAKESGYFPLDVKKQICWGLFISQRQWCDYCQYSPEIANAGYDPLIVERVGRDEKMIKELIEGADQFLKEMWAIVNRVMGKPNP